VLYIDAHDRIFRSVSLCYVNNDAQKIIDQSNMPCKQHNKETPTTSLSSDDEKEDTFDEDDKDGGFSKFAPIGEAPMTRALSGYDPTSARTMTAQQAKDGRPRGKQWWKEKFPMFVEVRGCCCCVVLCAVSCACVFCCYIDVDCLVL
jgi:hypothetical protein